MALGDFILHDSTLHVIVYEGCTIDGVQRVQKEACIMCLISFSIRSFLFCLVLYGSKYSEVFLPSQSVVSLRFLYINSAYTLSLLHDIENNFSFFLAHSLALL